MNLYLEASLALGKDLLKLAVMAIYMDALIFILYLNCEQGYKLFSNSMITNYFRNILKTEKALNLHQENLLTGPHAVSLSDNHLFSINDTIPKGQMAFSDSASKTEWSCGHQTNISYTTRQPRNVVNGLSRVSEQLCFTWN